MVDLYSNEYITIYMYFSPTLQVSNVSIDEPMFQPFPSEIFYQNFEPFETYEVPLVLRNNDKVSFYCFFFLHYFWFLVSMGRSGG